MEIKSHILKISGKSESPKPLDIGNNYHIALAGAITTVTDSDNDDGSLTRIYTFKPIRVEVLNPLGETIKLKDTRSNSQLMRSLLYKRWVNAASAMSFEDYYTKVMGAAMVNVDKIIDWAQVD